MFGRRKRREEAAAEAAREAERHALFAQLAERPEHVCPFLGLAGERAGYIEGISDDHRCYAFGDPGAALGGAADARLPGARLRQLPALPARRAGHPDRGARGAPPPTRADCRAASPAPVPAERRRRRAAPLLLLLFLLLVGGGVTGYLIWGRALFPPVAVESSSPSPTPLGDRRADAVRHRRPERNRRADDRADERIRPGHADSRTHAVLGRHVRLLRGLGRAEGYTLFLLNGDGEVIATRDASFGGFSYARADPRRGADEPVFWETAEGGLEGWSYLYPDSGSFRVRAVFLNADNERRSSYLSEDELTEFPEATPAP